MNWFRFYHDSLNDPKVQRLPGEEYKAQLLATLNGAETEFSRFVKGPFTTRPSVSNWQRTRALVFARDGYVCVYCGKRGGQLECDHVLPSSRGGSDDPENLVTACFRCNRSKRDRTPEEWLP